MLAEWALSINPAKTERTTVRRHVDNMHEVWRTTRKLGSLLGDAEDVTRRIQLASAAFHKLWTVWYRRTHICLQLRLRLTKSLLDRLNTYHRCHLRQIIGIRSSPIDAAAVLSANLSQELAGPFSGTSFECHWIPQPSVLSTTSSRIKASSHTKADRAQHCRLY